MNRNEMLGRLKADGHSWDVAVIGGGATGVGDCSGRRDSRVCCVAAGAGGFRQGTSSRSTKLVHGGVRYLEQGNVSLVMEALKERGFLLENAPHLVHDLPFVVPNYSWWETPFYGIGTQDL